MVSDFVRTVSNQTLSPGVEFGVISRPGYEDQTRYFPKILKNWMAQIVFKLLCISYGEYAGNLGPRILNYYSKQFFEIGFPLPKMDKAAIPDFSAGYYFLLPRL